MTNKDSQTNSLEKRFNDLKFKQDRHNFSSIDVYDKNIQVKGFIRMKNFATAPTHAVVGDIAVIGGILKICTVAGVSPTWTVVGTQT